MSTDLTDGPVPTVQGEDVTVDLSDGVKFNEATVVIADVEANNGVIHAIDGVLLPPTVAEALDAFVATCPA
jgi:transforming growth factor-beta-induced protein